MDLEVPEYNCSIDDKNYIADFGLHYVPISNDRLHIEDANGKVIGVMIKRKTAVGDEWEFKFPATKLIHVHGVKMINSKLKTYTYEGIIFESTKNLSFKGMVNIKFDSEITSGTNLTAFNFEQITDTLVQFELRENIPANVYDFELVFYDFKE